MSIEFKQVERDCPYNNQWRRGDEGHPRPIIDYDVVINGEKRAEFRTYDPRSKGFKLQLLTGVDVEIPRKKQNRRPWFSGGERAFKEEFEDVILSAMARGQIPSVADQQKWKAEHYAIELDKAKVRWEKYCVSWRNHRLGDKADELLHMLQNVDKSSESAWHSWLLIRDQLVAYVNQPPPMDEAHLLAAGAIELINHV